jgi:hypothetical protein
MAGTADVQSQETVPFLDSFFCDVSRSHRVHRLDVTNQVMPFAVKSERCYLPSVHNVRRALRNVSQLAADQSRWPDRAKECTGGLRRNFVRSALQIWSIGGDEPSRQALRLGGG